MLGKIFGPSGFTPSSTDQVLGRFNDPIRGCAYVFLDEVLFAGDRKAADGLKSLSTSTEIGIETKGLPVIKCPIAVNLWLASNHEAAAHIEEHDRRYWVHAVSEHRIDDAPYFQALAKEIKNGGREAFANYLSNLTFSDFVPWRDIKKDNQAKRDMVRVSINPYDARKRLEDCCHTERLIGRRHPEGLDGWAHWEEGAGHSFADLRDAYVEWQKTVRSPVAPKPTKPRLGEYFTEGSNRARLRFLPSVEECLDALQEKSNG